MRKDAVAKPSMDKVMCRDRGSFRFFRQLMRPRNDAPVMTTHSSTAQMASQTVYFYIISCNSGTEILRGHLPTAAQPYANPDL